MEDFYAALVESYQVSYTGFSLKQREQSSQGNRQSSSIGQEKANIFLLGT